MFLAIYFWYGVSVFWKSSLTNTYAHITAREHACTHIQDKNKKKKILDRLIPGLALPLLICYLDEAKLKDTAVKWVEERQEEAEDERLRVKCCRKKRGEGRKCNTGTSRCRKADLWVVIKRCVSELKEEMCIFYMWRGSGAKIAFEFIFGFFHVPKFLVLLTHYPNVSTNKGVFYWWESSSLLCRVSGHDWKYITQRRQSTLATMLTINLRVRGPCRKCGRGEGEKKKSFWLMRKVHDAEGHSI